MTKLEILQEILSAIRKNNEVIEAINLNTFQTKRELSSLYNKFLELLDDAN